ncbi:hypothetical protein ACV566_00985 [Staphylococcus aureus]
MAKENSIVLKNMPISVLSVTLTMETTLTAAIATVLAKMVTQLHNHMT